MNAGIWNSGVLGGISNWARSSVFALGLASMSPLLSAGCGDAGPPTGPNGINPLDPPDGGDTTIPPGPRNDFGTCFPANHALSILIDGQGATFGTPPSAPADGGSVMALDRESLCFANEPCASGLGLSGGANAFRVRGRWASPPLELNNPDAPGYGTMLSRANGRRLGNPLSQLTRPGLTGSWAQQFPASVNAGELGVTYWIDGEFNSANCGVEMTIFGAVMDPSTGLSDPLERVALMLYRPRGDGNTHIAEANFANEMLVIQDTPLDATFTFAAVGDADTERRSAPYEVCEGDCDDVSDAASNPQRLVMTLISAPREDAGVGETGTGGSDGGSDAGTGGSDGGSDSGIPPLPPPDAGSGG